MRGTISIRDQLHTISEDEMTSLATHGANALLSIVPMLDAHSEFELEIYVAGYREDAFPAFRDASILGCVTEAVDRLSGWEDYRATIVIRAMGAYGCVAKFVAGDMTTHDMEFGMVVYNMLSNGFAPE